MASGGLEVSSNRLERACRTYLWYVGRFFAKSRGSGSTYRDFRANFVDFGSNLPKSGSSGRIDRKSGNSAWEARKTPRTRSNAFLIPPESLPLVLLRYFSILVHVIRLPVSSFSSFLPFSADFKDFWSILPTSWSAGKNSTKLFDQTFRPKFSTKIFDQNFRPKFAT